MTALREEAVRALLDERSLALARRGRAAARVENRIASFLVCRARTSLVGLPVAEIGGILASAPCRALPDAPRAVLGLIALSGGVVTLIDLARALGFDYGNEAGEADESVRHVVRLRGRNASVALAVDRALGIVGIAEDAISQTMPTVRDSGSLGSDAVSGYAAPGAGGADGVTDGFVIIDTTRLVGRFLP